MVVEAPAETLSKRDESAGKSITDFNGIGAGIAGEEHARKNQKARCSRRTFANRSYRGGSG